MEPLPHAAPQDLAFHRPGLISFLLLLGSSLWIALVEVMAGDLNSKRNVKPQAKQNVV
jgi:hypothetical protein